jgi:hypothetical protein
MLVKVMRFEIPKSVLFDRNTMYIVAYTKCGWFSMKRRVIRLESFGFQEAS